MAIPQIPKISLEKSWKLTPQVFILVTIGILAILGIIIFIASQKKALPPEVLPPQKEKTTEEVLESLTVPEEKRSEIKEVPPEVIESLTAPSKK